MVYKSFRIDKRCSVDVGLQKPNYISTETLSSLSIAINILAATLNTFVDKLMTSMYALNFFVPQFVHYILLTFFVLFSFAQIALLLSQQNFEAATSSYCT